ncbi:MAG: 3-dehydroquinate synthase [Candidatus Omnitrophota bacterium]
MPKKIIVHLGHRSYPIFVAHDRFRALGPLVKKMQLGDRLFVVANPDALNLYGKYLRRSLKRSGISVFYPTRKLPTGTASEKAKSQKWVDYLVRELVRCSQGGRQIVMAAFSGGVLGDLTGYVAAIYKRGIPYLQIPTTLLAQVDSSIGGKVGIDLSQGKNLLGAFYQPRFVYADLTVLESLPLSNFRDGLAEVVKYGMIADPALFSFLEKHSQDLLPSKKMKKPDRKALEYIVSACVRIKSRIVARDEKDDKGIRVILNFGHTLGHAIEQARNYRERHGQAISVGMVCAAEIACRMGLCRKETLQRLESLLQKLGLPVEAKGISQQKLFKAEALDKKFMHGRNRYVLPVRIGKVVVREGVPYRIIRQVMSERILS